MGQSELVLCCMLCGDSRNIMHSSLDTRDEPCMMFKVEYFLLLLFTRSKHNLLTIEARGDDADSLVLYAKYIISLRMVCDGV